jgi:hypothetical protein
MHDTKSQLQKHEMVKEEGMLQDQESGSGVDEVFPPPDETEKRRITYVDRDGRRGEILTGL